MRPVAMSANQRPAAMIQRHEYFPEPTATCSRWHELPIHSSHCRAGARSCEAGGQSRRRFKSRKASDRSGSQNHPDDQSWRPYFGQSELTESRSTRGLRCLRISCCVKRSRTLITSVSRSELITPAAPARTDIFRSQPSHRGTKRVGSCLILL